jgi:type IV pilus assembly protein PilM
MPAIGLDISDEMIRFIELVQTHSGFEVGMHGEEAISKEIIEEGYVRDPKALTKILADLKDKHDLHFVNVSLPEEKVYLFKTQIPVIDEADIRSALQYKIEENVPVGLPDAVFDYHIISEDEGKLNIGVTVTHMKVVSSYLVPLQDAGLVPLRLLPESQTIANIVIPKNDPDTHILVAVRETKTIFAIISQGVVQFSSTLPIGASSIAAAVKKGMTADEAEASAPPVKERRDSNQMYLNIMNPGSVIKEEVQKLFTYWEGHGGEHNPIKTLILTGASVLDGLDTYMAQAVEMPVRVANAWTNIAALGDYVPPITLKESLDYIPALGLAMLHD